jgi:hypothetical protein
VTPYPRPRSIIGLKRKSSDLTTTARLQADEASRGDLLPQAERSADRLFTLQPADEIVKVEKQYTTYQTRELIPDVSVVASVCPADTQYQTASTGRGDRRSQKSGQAISVMIRLQKRSSTINDINK